MIARSDHADDAVVAPAHERGPRSAPGGGGLTRCGRPARACIVRPDVVDSAGSLIG